MNKNVADARGQARRFSLSMADWDTYNMANRILNDLKVKEGMDSEAADKVVRAVLGASTFGPAVNVETGNEAGVVVESKGGVLTLIGFIDFKGGSEPTARLVLDETTPTFHIRPYR